MNEKSWQFSRPTMHYLDGEDWVLHDPSNQDLILDLKKQVMWFDTRDEALAFQTEKGVPGQFLPIQVKEYKGAVKGRVKGSSTRH